MGVDNQDFASKTFNIIRQLLLSIKAREVANRAVYNLQNGKKVVVAFANTMESMLNNLGANEGETINPDYSISLLSGLDSTRRITEKDDSGGSSYRMIEFDEIGEEGFKFYNSLVQKIRKNTSGITISPIDLMKHIINEAGFEVSEVTGRQFQLNFSKDLTKATVASRKKENVTDAYRKFQNNEVDVLFVNKSGSTGASAHAKRVLYVAGEERLGYTLQEKVERLNVANPNLYFNDKLPKDLSKFDAIFIDSINTLGLEPSDLERLPKDKAYAWILQCTKDGNYRGSQAFEHNADSVIEVADMTARMGKNRFGGKEKEFQV